MSNPKLVYFEKGDVLHLTLSNEQETNSVEISPNITAELNDSGELIGIEIIGATVYIRDFILESVQARLLAMSKNAVTI